MKDLIAAFGIFLKYVEEGSYAFNYPTHCEHDELFVNVNPDVVSREDLVALEALSFTPSENYFSSFRFGSC